MQQVLKSLFLFGDAPMNHHTRTSQFVLPDLREDAWHFRNDYHLHKLMQGSILPVTIPPGHTPGDLQFFSYLAVYSPPPGT